jgi:REP element-mobilizing transposase RayT
MHASRPAINKTEQRGKIMARPLRMEWPGALYHITDRGNEKKAIFRDDEDRHRLLQYVAEGADTFQLCIHAFCLMDNHYHFEIETPRGNLSQAMQWLNTAYTVSFNRRHGRSGHLFQGRYKAAVVEKESHLLELTRYIHLNPVRAGMVARPEEYIWSSYLEYIAGRRRWMWLETEWALGRFEGTNAGARRRYRRFVEEGIFRELPDPLEQMIGGTILGSDRFMEKVQAHLLDHRDDPPAVTALKKIRRISIPDVIREVTAALEVSEMTIRSRGRHSNDARAMAIFLARRHCAETNMIIGREFGGISGAAVTQILQKVKDRLCHDRGFGDLLENIEQNLILKG